MRCKFSLLLALQLSQLSLGVDMSVLTQNLQFIPFAGGTNDMMNKRVNEYGELLIGLGDNIPDVIGFTEMFLEGPTNITLAKIAKTHPHQLNSFPQTPLPEGKLVNSGLALASKFPIEAHDFRMFTKTWSTDAYATKGVLVALIRLPASFAVVSVTHMQGSADAPIYESQLGTINELVENFVRGTISASAVNYTTVISMGDFNIKDDSYLYPRMMDTLAYEVEDPHRSLNPGEDGFTSSTGNPNNPDNRVDYIFNLKMMDESGMCAFPSSVVIDYAANLLVTKGELEDVEGLSDHLGVEATFSIGENPDGALPNLINDGDSCNPFSRTVSSTDRAKVETVILGILFVIPMLAL